MEILLSDWTDNHMTSSLIIESLTDVNYGQYVCAASNTYGKVI